MKKVRMWKRAALILLSAVMVAGTPVIAMADENADITWVDPDNFVDPPYELWWNGMSAQWEEVGGYGYDVRLYHDGSAVDTVTVTGTSHSFSSKMNRSGSYYFRVRTIDYNGAYSEWSDKSDVKHVSSSNNNHHNVTPTPTPAPTPAQTGWVSEPSGRWWWRNADGTYPANTWQMINNVWYYFEQSGYMHTGWLDYNGARYYCQPNGAMVVGWNNVNERWYYFEPTIGTNYGKLWVNAKTPDGHTLGADGARTDF